VETVSNGFSASVSHSSTGQVAAYIAAQQARHRKRSFAEALWRLVDRYGLKWHEEVETVGNGFMATAGH